MSGYGGMRMLQPLAPDLDSSVAFEFRVQLQPEEGGDVREPQPDEEHDHPGEAAVGLVVGAEVVDVEWKPADAASHTSIARSAPGMSHRRP